MSSSMPLRAPSSSAVFKPLAMVSLYLVQAEKKGGHERGTPRQIGHHDVLVKRVGAVPFRAEAV